eukprot:6212455-Pleurochrysis_carterae.AAC.2
MTAEVWGAKHQSLANQSFVAIDQGNSEQVHLDIAQWRSCMDEEGHVCGCTNSNMPCSLRNSMRVSEPIYISCIHKPCALWTKYRRLVASGVRRCARQTEHFISAAMESTWLEESRWCK